MHLYIDPTEARPDSRVPSHLLIQSISLPGLESITGADWMITPLAWPDGAKCESTRPCELRLQAHIESGAILIQRKSGSDFIQSIPDLKDFQERMLQWTGGNGRCWLLVTGIKIETVNGEMVCIADGDGHHVCSLSSVEGAISKWKLRGGNVEILANDEAMTYWFGQISKSLTDCIENPIREFNVVSPIQKLKREPENWVTTRSAFPPGIGRAKLESLARELGSDDPVRNPPPLARVMQYLTAGRIVNASGWGKTLQKNLLEWWGLPSDGSRYVRDLPRFESVTLRFDEPLPMEFEGDGIEQVGETEYKFTNYESMESIAMMLFAMKG